MKAVCIISSKNVVIDGDVVFHIRDKSKLEAGIFIDFAKNNLTFKGNGFLYIQSYHWKMGFKLSLLWFWHMVLLRKSHVYLTGVLR